MLPDGLLLASLRAVIYEVERLYFINAQGEPAQEMDTLATVAAESSRSAAMTFMEREGARLLGTIREAPGDQCAASAWRNGRFYVITIWPAGKPHDAIV